MADDDEDMEEGGADNGAEGDDGADGEAEAEEAGGLPLKKILIILVPLLLLTGGGAAAYFMGFLDPYIGGGAAAEEGAAEGGESHGAAASESGGHGGGHGEGGEASSNFLEIPTMIVNLNSEDGTPRYLRLTVQLELANSSDKDAVQAVIPRVVDQFQTYLRELRVRDLRGSAGIYRLQMELLWRVNQAAAPIEVKDVLFQEILIQ
ncbi:MAG: flagellar basal body-associated FliL family protein [Alphaproteobacteria bacterium]|nr:flagellar basal body-associated FliL family protein [Alphaproteobacteria bacterium]